MTGDAETDHTATVAPPAQKEGLRPLLARHGWAMLAAAAATVAVELGAYLLGVVGGVQPAQAVLAALAASVLWVALAAPVLAATADDTIGALLRGGTIVDASVITLIVLWLTSPLVGLATIAKLYCILLAMGLAEIAACRLHRRASGRLALAVVAAAVVVASLASPFWIGGPIHGADRDAARRLVAAAVYANPFYSATAALAGEMRFIWHQATVMYRITRIGDYAPAPPGCWYASVALHAPAALLLAAVGALLHRRPRTP